MFAFSLIAIANHFLKSSKNLQHEPHLVEMGFTIQNKKYIPKLYLLSFKTFIYVLGFASKEFSSANHYQHYQTEAGLHPRDLVKLIVNGVLHSLFGMSEEAPAELIIMRTHSSKIMHYKILGAFWRQRLHKSKKIIIKKCFLRRETNKMKLSCDKSDLMHLRNTSIIYTFYCFT